MIKFVATDLDGTLLPDSSKFPEEEDYEAIKKLQSKGVLFAAASGRQYPNLKRLFAPVWENMIFICENGAMVIYRGKLLSIIEMNHSLALDVIRDIESIEGCESLISTESATYILPKTDYYPIDLRTNWNTDFTVAPSIASLTMPIVKVSLYQESGLEESVVKHMKERWSGDFNVAVSGRNWLDVTIANKGMAIRSVKERFNLSRSEMAVFADNFNDIEMLDEVEHGFVMKTAVPEIHKHGKYVCTRVRDSINDMLNHNLQL